MIYNNKFAGSNEGFTVGQRVKCISGDGWPLVTEGKVYTVVRLVGDACIEVVDDEGRTGGSPYAGRFVKHSATACEKQWIIALFEEGGLKPDPKPKVYCSLKQANNVAKQMAEKHSKPFVVLEAVGVAEPVEVKAELKSI